MSGHYEGKVAVLVDRLVPADHLERKIGGSTNKKEDKANYAHEIALVRGKYQDDQANARYMAACWNACEGSKVEDLEELGSDYIAPVIKLIDRANNACALLQEVLNESSGNNAYPSAHDASVAWDDRMARIRAFLEVK